MESEQSTVLPLPAEAGHVSEQVSPYGWKALAGSVIGFSMDGFDMLILGFMLAAVSTGLALTSVQAGSLVTRTMLGAVTGGLIFGAMSDSPGPNTSADVDYFWCSPCSPRCVRSRAAIGTWSRIER